MERLQFSEFQVEICLQPGQSVICKRALTLAASQASYPPSTLLHGGCKGQGLPAETGQEGLKTSKKQENGSIFLSELNAL